jgi:putative flavoprotein involved in K+ transport
MERPLNVIVIGGGQAGLAAGHYLAKRDLRFVILEAASRVGDSWRSRWDSLVLFSPARYSSLPGLPFPGEPDRYPGKDEMGDYLELYAQELDLPVRLESRVRSLSRVDGRYVAEVEGTAYEAPAVIVAAGGFQRPQVPGLASELTPDVVQIHSAEYRRPDELPPGPVMVVGAAASGLQIADELADERKVYISVGSRVPSLPDFILGKEVFWWLDHLPLTRITIDTPLGRRMSRRPLIKGDSLRKLSRRDTVERVERAVEARGRAIVCDDGRAVEVPSVVWATGFRADYSWIDIPAFDDTGLPIHRRGVTEFPGLYFLGMRWQHNLGSSLIGWVRHDAEFIADHAAERARRFQRGAP